MIGKEPESFIKQEQDTFVFDQEQFNQMVSDKLQINPETMRSNPFEEFVTNVSELGYAKAVFRGWMESTDENAKIKINKIGAVNKAIATRYVKKLKETLGFDIEDKNKFYEYCDRRVTLQDALKLYLDLRKKGNSTGTFASDDELPGVDEEAWRDELDDEEISQLDSSESFHTIEGLKQKFELTEQDIEFIMIAIDNHLKDLAQNIDLFFKNDYTRLLNDHSLGNLTLLSGSVNSVVKNKSY
ncbi:hypothetical protein [Paenibacillus sp. sgz5001063]|uniref:hypothetical protein n=1 Tax=Paenibacillus sp. sgz5001063 TaxID=3242474 RepID=UPI0036D3D214